MRSPAWSDAVLGLTRMPDQRAQSSLPGLCGRFDGPRAARSLTGALEPTFCREH
jgi:hypothetical protein